MGDPSHCAADGFGIHDLGLISETHQGWLIHCEPDWLREAGQQRLAVWDNKKAPPFG
jgi:hypothetical protein